MLLQLFVIINYKYIKYIFSRDLVIQRQYHRTFVKYVKKQSEDFTISNITSTRPTIAESVTNHFLIPQRKQNIKKIVSITVNANFVVQYLKVISKETATKDHVKVKKMCNI